MRLGEPNIFQDEDPQLLSHATHAANCPSNALDPVPSLEYRHFLIMHTETQQTVEAISRTPTT